MSNRSTIRILTGIRPLHQLGSLNFLPSALKWWDGAKAKLLEKTVILFVEDEALIRLATTSLLEEVGYTVIEACNADVAIQILESGTDIHAVFTDIRMPGSLDGLWLSNVIRERWPPVHLLVTSGLPPNEDAFPRRTRFLPKPYAPKHVLKAFHELFDSNLGPHRYRHSVTQTYGRV